MLKISNCTESRPFQILTNIVLLGLVFIGFLWFSIVFYGFSIHGYFGAGAEFFVGLKVHVELGVQFSHLGLLLPLLGTVPKIPFPKRAVLSR